jgi:phage baseplate assembly protein W
MALGLYRGFSSHEYRTKKVFGISDIELVKLDLLNHIFTRKGERVMMPNFGTRIPDMIFEPLDELTLMIIDEDLNDVIKFDPRVELVSMSVVPDYDNNTVIASVQLYYIEFKVVDGMDINITFEGTQ